MSRRSCQACQPIPWLLALAFFWMPVASALAFESMAYSVVGAEGRTTLRWVGQQDACPAVLWGAGTDSRTLPSSASMPPREPLQLRVAPQQATEVPGRSRAVDFPVRVCEIAWPDGVHHATVGQQQLQRPDHIRRIAIMADTGCRMIASENAFQDCNDPQQWPFAQLADAAARMQPDLVLHIGGIHYRESPCPQDRPGCAGSPSGYGWPAWDADFFSPARRLLQAAPWVMVRGNHESCARAGQGWFRFVDAAPWQADRSCIAPTDDARAAHSRPYAVPIGGGTGEGGAQFIVFDSSVANNQVLEPSDPLFVQYMQGWREVETLAARGPSVFLSHHPLLAVMAAPKSGQNARAAGNASLLSVARSGWGDALFPRNVGWAMHGHIHVFESLSFRSQHPASLILGNAGSAMDKAPPEQLSSGLLLAPGVEVEAYTGHARFGFSMLELPQAPAQAWTLTQYDTTGQPMLRCQLSPLQSHCTPTH